MAVGIRHRITYSVRLAEGGSGQWDINIEHQTEPCTSHPPQPLAFLYNTNPKDNRRCIHQASAPFCCCEFLMPWCPFLYGGLRADRLLHTRLDIYPAAACVIIAVIGYFYSPCLVKF